MGKTSKQTQPRSTTPEATKNQGNNNSSDLTTGCSDGTTNVGQERSSGRWSPSGTASGYQECEGEACDSLDLDDIRELALFSRRVGWLSHPLSAQEAFCDCDMSTKATECTSVCDVVRCILSASLPTGWNEASACCITIADIDARGVSPYCEIIAVAYYIRRKMSSFDKSRDSRGRRLDSVTVFTYVTLHSSSSTNHSSPKPIRVSRVQ